jgi:indole-3-glycerol phosphate synthase
MSDERQRSGAGSRRPAQAYDQPAPGGFLAEMIAGSRRRVAAARVGGRLRRPEQVGEPGHLREALARPTWTPGAPSPQLAVIAEVKRRSPSKGEIAPELDAVAQARAYQAAGADAISVLTEPTRFGGSLDDLRAVAAAVDLPVLRKDFIVDRGQIWEAAEAGAAAVLLIVAILSDDRLHDLLIEALDCGLDPLVEVHDLDETRRACRAGCTLVGINNRDLVTLEVDLETTEYLAPALGPCMFPVSESGISTPADACRAALAGARALLVGETLVRTPPDELPALIGSLKDPGWPA